MKKEPTPLKSYFYQDYVERFEEYVRQIGYSKNTQKQMPRSLREFLCWLEQENIEQVQQVNTAHLKAFYCHLQTRPNARNQASLSQSHITSIIYGIRVFYQYLLSNGEIDHNPLDNLHFPRAKYLHREALSKAQIQELYAACETLRDRAFLSIYYGCGLRFSEGVALKVSDINFADGVLYVRQGKGNKRRAVPMNSRVVNDLMSYYRLERPKVSNPHFLLNNANTAARNWVTIRIKQLVVLAGLASHYSLHHLRHSIATHLLENGMKVELVSSFLGHSHLESTQIYAKVSTEHLHQQF